ncbi:MAG TPA: xanthine dehydrogenase family protein molybdopterin-binding subunit [Methylomirabilota bacterium]|jgi:xanthine dehydrogenase molybdenum-binding subunit|nr:xanthine dehydrogenase family protein molybdopterin-binding subunit [Methylomirabilota bacterium]
MTELAIIGKGVPKRDGADKVTGRTRYLHDLELPRLAHGKILRARHPHARIRRIDTARAAALPGVLAVITAQGVEQHPFGFAKDQLALKGDTVRCVRDEVAAVAAETAAIAEAALELIDVDYEERPAVFDPRAAVQPGAPLVHESRPSNHTDLRYQFSHGDVERAFAEAAVVVEGEFRLNFVTPACLGTMVAIADWDLDGRLTMWSTTQVPFLYQRDLAQALGISGDRVRVLQPPVGGNFGRGLDLYPIDIIAALLARRTNRPVKIEFERLEEFLACPTREPCTIRLRTAADGQGRLLGRDCHVIIDNGAYVSWGSTTPYVMLSTVAGLYRCPAVRFDTTIAYTNNPYSGSMRGYGNLESTFAVESQMDEVAERLGLDRLEVRRRNVTRSGDANPQGFTISSCAMAECLDALDGAAAGVPAPPPGWQRGVGYAGMFHVGGGARIYRSDGCGAIVKLDDFGRVSLLTGATEIGQGSETVLAMIVAETLGIPLDRIDVVNSDTVVKPWDVGAHASRTTFIAGNAARLAAEKLRARLLAMAAVELEAPVERLRLTGGMIVVDGEPGRRIAYDRAARAGHLREQGSTLVAEAFYDPPTEMLDKDLRGNVSATYGFAAQAAVIDVERATGRIRVRRIVSAHDVGRALNPLAAEGQIHGGIHMGLGYALSERLVVEGGQVLTASFMDYAMLKADDMPELVVRLIESGEAEGPFGAKGLGESGVIPVSAAVANAVKDATGVRFRELPITAPVVHAALDARP